MEPSVCLQVACVRPDHTANCPQDDLPVNEREEIEAGAEFVPQTFEMNGGEVSGRGG